VAVGGWRRTTELTRGRATAFELDNVVVGYDLGNFRFDNQIEIESDIVGYRGSCRFFRKWFASTLPADRT
jgi:hypothetical protein